MSPNSSSNPSPPGPPKKKEQRIFVRVDDELKDKAEQKARSRGWTLSSLIRAWIKVFAEDDENNVDPADVGRASMPAPKGKHRKKTEAGKQGGGGNQKK